MDLSDWDNASIIQDLSDDLPKKLERKFDVIYDEGTCEHIFDLPTAYRNIHKMLKKGGVLIGHNPCNNWVNHSFYQINPEMVYMDSGKRRWDMRCCIAPCNQYGPCMRSKWYEQRTPTLPENVRVSLARSPREASS